MLVLDVFGLDGETRRSGGLASPLENMRAPVMSLAFSSSGSNSTL